MKIILLLFAACLLGYNSDAQLKPQFSSQNYVGILEGDAQTSFQFQTINGFKYRGWFAGAGTGIDYYFQRSIPVFFSLSKFLSSTKVPLYFTGDFGINIPWIKEVTWFRDPGGFEKGLYWGGGMGYRFGLKKTSNAFLLNFGYSGKNLFHEESSVSPCLVPPCPVMKQTYKYNLNRLSVRVGFTF